MPRNTTGFSVGDMIEFPNSSGFGPKILQAVVIGFSYLGADGSNTCLVATCNVTFHNVTLHPSHATCIRHVGVEYLDTWRAWSNERKANWMNLDWIFSPLRSTAVPSKSFAMLWDMLERAAAGMDLPVYDDEWFRMNCANMRLDRINKLLCYTEFWDHDGFNALLARAREAQTVNV